MSGLLYILKKLKQNFDGKFIITKQVKEEIVESPMQIKKYELEAMGIQQLINDKILESPSALGIDENEINSETSRFMEIANNMYTARGERMKIVSKAECSCVALSIILTKRKQDNLLIIDERTIRMLLENPENLRELYEKKLHTDVKMNYKRATDLNCRIIRSSEIVYIADKKGVVEISDGKQLLDALLYSVKYRGCSISREEIEDLKEMI
jgi:hypothetical protein